MGPFAWNEATNSWVNQNNGFSIPNISLQDLLMYDFGTVTDETESSNYKSTPCVYTLPAFTPSSQDGGTFVNRVPSNILGFQSQTLSNITCPVIISYVASPSNTGLLGDWSIYTSVNAGATKPKLNAGTGVSVSAGTFRVYIGPSANVLSVSKVTIDIINVSDGNTVLATYQATPAPA
jgi:hypothetical protein